MTLPLETPRLRLRLLAPADASFIRELVNDPAWLRFIGDRHVRTTADAEAYIEKCLAMHREHGVGLLAVDLKSVSRPIGLCGLLRRPGLADLDLGYAFLKDCRSRGYAREAAACVLQHGATTLTPQRIVAYTHPDNAASAALLRSLGFQFEATTTIPGASRSSLLFVSTLPSRDAAAP